MAKRLILLAVAVALSTWVLLLSRERREEGKLPPISAPVRSEARTAPTIGSRTASEAEKPRNVAEILMALPQLARDDQAGLEVLFAEMRRLIVSDPERAHADFVSRIPSFAELPLEESFFLVHCLLHFGDRPGAIVESVLEHSVPGERTPGDSHGHSMTPWERYERVKAFAIRHLREAIAGGQITQKSQPHLVARLKEIAERERSLDIAREATKLLARISPHAKSDLEEALRNRPANEREFLVP